jgi:chromosome segregation ATPase
MSIAEIIGIVLSGILGGGIVSALANWYKSKSDVKRSEFDILGDTLDKMDKRNQELERRIEAERTARRLIECDFDKYKSDNEDRIKALEDALLAKDKEIAALQEQARVLEDAVKRLEEQLEKLGETPITKKKGTGPLMA